MRCDFRAAPPRGRGGIIDRQIKSDRLTCSTAEWAFRAAVVIVLLSHTTVNRRRATEQNRARRRSDRRVGPAIFAFKWIALDLYCVALSVCAIRGRSLRVHACPRPVYECDVNRGAPCAARCNQVTAGRNDTVPRVVIFENGVANAHFDLDEPHNCSRRPVDNDTNC